MVNDHYPYYNWAIIGGIPHFQTYPYDPMEWSHGSQAIASELPSKWMDPLPPPGGLVYLGTVSSFDHDFGWKLLWIGNNVLPHLSHISEILPDFHMFFPCFFHVFADVFPCSLSGTSQLIHRGMWSIRALPAWIKPARAEVGSPKGRSQKRISRRFHGKFMVWLVVTGTWILYFPIDWEFHHPNWRSPSFFRGVETTNQWWLNMI